MQLVIKPFSFPTMIIKEGKIDFNALQQSGKDPAWLENKFLIFNVAAQEILLATLDDNDDMKIYLYH